MWPNGRFCAYGRIIRCREGVSIIFVGVMGSFSKVKVLMVLGLVVGLVTTDVEVIVIVLNYFCLNLSRIP